jgi:hypothetical protein
MADYQHMRWATKENAGQLGVLYKDSKKRSIIRSFDGADTPTNSRQVYLTRDQFGIYVDGVYFEIEKLGIGEKQMHLRLVGNPSERNYHQEIDELADFIRKREVEIAGNILLSPEDKKVMEANVRTLNKELAFLREDLQKLEE